MTYPLEQTIVLSHANPQWVRKLADIGYADWKNHVRAGGQFASAFASQIKGLTSDAIPTIESETVSGLFDDLV